MFVGMDVHKESIDVSLAEDGRDGEVRHYGVIPGDLEAVAKVVRALRAPTRRLRFVYEAGPCGFGIHRYLTEQGEDCVVVADQLRQQTPAWRWAPVVDALQALRGVSFVTAVGLVVEVGDIRRFDHPRRLMAFLGLVPSEYSSGPSVRRGGITKAGNPHARRLLAEAAWAYQGVPRIGRQMLYRQEALPTTVCEIAWKAQLRLTSRFRKLVARGKAKPKAATAIARELTGFIWAIAREVPAPPA
jgi:transposase